MNDKNICLDKVYQYSFSMQFDDYIKLVYFQKIQKIIKVMMKQVKVVQVLLLGIQKNEIQIFNVDCYLSIWVFYFS